MTLFSQCIVLNTVLVCSLVLQQNYHQKVFYKGALHLCSGAWHSEIWTNTTVLWCFIC